MTEKMRQMIDRFYLGELTIDEERRLIGLLLSDDCPMDLRVERHALIMLARQEAIDMPGDLEKRVVGAIKSHTLKIYWWLSAVAAFLLIIGMGYWGFLHKEIQQSPSISASENHGDKNHGDRSMILYGIKRPVPMILKTKPQHALVTMCEPEEVTPASTASADTVALPAPTEQEQHQAVERKAKPAEQASPIIYPSDLHHRKHIDSRLTAQVYMSSTMAGGKTESFNNYSYSLHTGDPEIDTVIVTNTQSHHRQPVRFGVSLRYRFNDRWSVEGGLSYTRLSSDITVIEDGFSTVTEQRLNYIGLPLNVSYDLWKSRYFGLYVTVGGLIDKRLDASPWQFSLNGGAGAEYKLTDFFSLYAEPGLGYYFKDGSSTPTIYQDHPLNFNFSLGLRFNVK